MRLLREEAGVPLEDGDDGQVFLEAGAVQVVLARQVAAERLRLGVQAVEQRLWLARGSLLLGRVEVDDPARALPPSISSSATVRPAKVSVLPAAPGLTYSIPSFSSMSDRCVCPWTTTRTLGAGPRVLRPVDEVDPEAVDLDRRVRGEAARHERVVHVAVHGDDRRYRFEALDDVEAADVAGVEDAFDAAEDVGKSRVEVAVRVGDEADEHRLSPRPRHRLEGDGRGPQRRRPVAQLADDDAHVAPALRERLPLRRLPRRPQVEVAHLRQAAVEDDDLRVEDVDQAAEADSRGRGPRRR